MTGEASDDLTPVEGRLCAGRDAGPPAPDVRG